MLIVTTGTFLRALIDFTIYAAGSFVMDAQSQAVAQILPEPGEVALQLAGLLGVGVLRRLRQR